jgi:hypothetical protein
LHDCPGSPDDALAQSNDAKHVVRRGRCARDGLRCTVEGRDPSAETANEGICVKFGLREMLVFLR